MVKVRKDNGFKKHSFIVDRSDIQGSGVNINFSKALDFHKQRQDLSVLLADSPT